jgi:hypothetical protein
MANRIGGVEMVKVIYEELSRAKLKDKRVAVISKNKNIPGYTIAQQITIKDGTENLKIFMKGSFSLGGLENLYELRDALNEAIIREESQEASRKPREAKQLKESDNEDW